MKGLPVGNLPVTLPGIAFFFWFTAGLKGLLIYALFRENPWMGTLVGGGISGCFAFLAFMTMPLCRGPRQRVRFAGAARVAILYLLWSVASLSWTYAASPATCLAYLVVMGLDLYVVYCLFAMDDAGSVAAASLQGIVLGALLLAVVVLATGASTVGGRLGNDEFLHPNTVGNQMGLACMCATWLSLAATVRKRRARWGGIALILFLTLLQSLSKTSILAFFAAMLVYLCRMKISLKHKAQILASLCVASLCMWGRLSSYLGNYLNDTQDGEALTTVSGRSFIWEKTWEMIQARPVLGYGYMSFRDQGPQTAEALLVHAHNELLQNLFTLGVVGLVLTVLLYLLFYLHVRRSELPTAALGLCILVYSLVRGATEASPTGLLFPLPLMFLFLCRPSVSGRRLDLPVP